MVTEVICRLVFFILFYCKLNKFLLFKSKLSVKTKESNSENFLEKVIKYAEVKNIINSIPIYYNI